MKSIKMGKAIKIGQNDTDYKELIKSCLERTPQGGFSIDQIRNRIRVLDKLKGAKVNLKLEDAEYSTLVDAVKNMRWALPHAYIVQFHDAVMNAK